MEVAWVQLFYVCADAPQKRDEAGLGDGGMGKREMLGCPGHGWHSIYNSSKTVLCVQGTPFLAPWASFLRQMDTCDRRPVYASPPRNAPARTGWWTHRQHSPARSRRDTSIRSRSAGGSVRGFGGRAMAWSSRQPSASETLCQRRAPRSPRSSPRGSAIGAPPTPPPALPPAQRRHSPTRVLGAALQLRSARTHHNAASTLGRGPRGWG